MTQEEDDRLFGEEHVRVYRETGGERGYHWRGTTILLLTTTGRKSGETRTTPLIHRVDGGRWIVVASKGGAPEHPGWFLNLSENPDVEIQVRDEVIPARASVVGDEEHDRIWSLMTEVWPDYDSYQEKTDRRIPLVALERR
jgi:deazaflavin-dependent oxidoreductase (nitroreductase family)